jgi:acyl-CoA synthetase
VPPDLERQWREAGYWDDLTIGAHLDRGLADHPEQVIRFHSAVRPWEGTFAEVRRRALGLAESLRRRGVGPGDPVAFQLPNWVEAAVTFYATTFLGAVVVPIVHFYGPKEVAYILQRTGVETFVTASSFGRTDYLAGLEPIRQSIDHLRTIAVVGAADGPLPEGLIRFDELEQEAGQLDGPVDVDPSSPAIIAYTSGTTADPKGVIHSHRTIGSEVRQLGAMDSGNGRPNLVGAPVGHAMGMLGGLLIPVLKGDPVNLIDVWDPARILRIMSDFELACGSGATYFLTSLLDHPDRMPEHLELMAYVGLGGSAIPTAIAERATAQGISIVRMYGSTEHPSITGSRHDEPVEFRLSTDGHVLPGVEIRIVDEEGRPVPPGQPGEIWSRGPDCCVGYTDPTLTGSLFDGDGWYRTEDIGVLDDQGYLSITDRKKDVIIRGGENVSAAAVEEVLLTVDGVAETAVVAAPDARLGEQVCAYLRMLPGRAPPDLAAVQDSMRQAGLARQKWPEQIRAVEEFPRTPSGKIKKAVLRQRLADEHGPPPATVHPSG